MLIYGYDIVNVTKLRLDVIYMLYIVYIPVMGSLEEVKREEIFTEDQVSSQVTN